MRVYWDPKSSIWVRRGVPNLFLNCHLKLTMFFNMKMLTEIWMQNIVILTNRSPLCFYFGIIKTFQIFVIKLNPNSNQDNPSKYHVSPRSENLKRKSKPKIFRGSIGSYFFSLDSTKMKIILKARSESFQSKWKRSKLVANPLTFPLRQLCIQLELGWIKCRKCTALFLPGVQVYSIAHFEVCRWQT